MSTYISGPFANGAQVRSSSLDRPATDRFKLLTFADASKPRPRRMEVVEGLIHDASVNLIFGEGATKKTYLCVDLGAAVAMGTPWLGRKTTQSSTLLVDEESGQRRLLDRFQAVGAARHLPSDAPMYATSLAGLDLYGSDEDATKLEELVSKLHAGLVIIDSLSMISGKADENATADMGRVMQTLRVMADRTGAAFVVIHHSNRARGYRGASKIRDAVDLALEVKSKLNAPTVSISTDKARDIAPTTLHAHVRFENDERGAAAKVFITVADRPEEKDPVPKGVGEKHVVQYLKLHGPSLKEDVKARAEETGVCAPGTAATAVHSLVEKGLVKRTDDGPSGKTGTYDLSPGYRAKLEAEVSR
ncbi:MAG: AAA family ATPase [Bacteroidota bacterium]